MGPALLDRRRAAPSPRRAGAPARRTPRGAAGRTRAASGRRSRPSLVHVEEGLHGLSISRNLPMPVSMSRCSRAGRCCTPSDSGLPVARSMSPGACAGRGLRQEPSKSSRGASRQPDPSPGSRGARDERRRRRSLPARAAVSARPGLSRGSRAESRRAPRSRLFWRRFRQRPRRARLARLHRLLDRRRARRAAGRDAARPAGSLRAEPEPHQLLRQPARPQPRAPVRRGPARPRRDVAGHLRRARRRSWSASSAPAVATLVGVAVGMLAGFYRGWVDTLLSRLIDVMLVDPDPAAGPGHRRRLLGARLRGRSDPARPRGDRVHHRARELAVHGAHRARARAVAARARVRGGVALAGRLQRAHHALRDPAEPDRADHRLRDADDPPEHPLRGGALVPGHRRAPTHRELGADDRRTPPRSSRPRGGTWSSRASRCSRPCSRSTCSATVCRTRSTRGAPREPPARSPGRRPGARTCSRRSRRSRSPAAARARALHPPERRRRPAGVQTPATQPQSGGRRGGTLTVLNHEDFENLDPGLAYFTLDYEIVDATQRPLYSNRPNTFDAPIPDMASGPPQISSDAKTITIHIRHGVHFSPPVNREVTSADVAYAIERGANPNVPNPYFHSYFSSLEGAEKADGGPFPGITTPNSETIVFHLDEPKAQIVVDALTLPLSAPVPEEYAKKFDAAKPSEYGNYQVATGPYMLKANSAGQGAGGRLPARQVGDARTQPQLESEHGLQARLPEPDQHQHRGRSERDRPPGARRLGHGAERHARAADRPARLRKLPHASCRSRRARARATSRSTTSRGRSPTSTCARPSGRRSTASRWTRRAAASWCRT